VVGCLSPDPGPALRGRTLDRSPRGHIWQEQLSVSDRCRVKSKPAGRARLLLAVYAGEPRRSGFPLRSAR